MSKLRISLTAALLSLTLSLSGCMELPGSTVTSFSMEDIPAYSGDPYVVINGNQPDFTEEDRTSTVSFESYSPLDALGRCGPACANIGQDLMPTEDRESISSVTPSGWINREYDGEYLYNRCHLIGFQLTGENANEENLITGTRYMNVDGMLPFENLAADYIRETGNHVLYRVTPVFEDRDLVASGVQMEAWSVEDSGEGVCFNVYVYNVQAGHRHRLRHRRELAGGRGAAGGRRCDLHPQHQQPQVPLPGLRRRGHHERCQQGDLDRQPGGSDGGGIRALRPVQTVKAWTHRGRQSAARRPCLRAVFCLSSTGRAGCSRR